jgi:hypothetical protein
MPLISQSEPVDYLLAYVTNSKAGTFVRFRSIKLDTLIELKLDSPNDRN